MSLEWIARALERAGDTEAVDVDGEVLRYAHLRDEVARWRAHVRQLGVARGDCVAFPGDYSVGGITAFVGCLLEGLIAVPLGQGVELAEGLQNAPVDWWLADGWTAERRAPTAHRLLHALRERDHAGVIVMTSGSSGEPKVILHDAEQLFEKFHHPRRSYRLLAFLLPDHMGGMNTLIGALTAGSTLIVPPSRTPGDVCRTIARTRATLLPVTPSFLTMLLVSDAAEAYDLSSLEVISYGTEVMPQATLDAAVQTFPNVRFVQLYGSSELGIFRGRSAADDSPFVRLEGGEFQVRDGRLFVRGADSMLGYLDDRHAGFDDDGWFDTGDLVEQDGPWLRFLGRSSELINVGGSKVFPAEVEAAVCALHGVLDCAVRGEPHPLTGHVVTARVRLSTDETARDFKRRMRAALRDRLEPFKIPVKVERVDALVGTRFKKLR